MTQYEPIVTASTAVDCNANGILTQNDTCIVQCNIINPSIPEVHCRNAGLCILECTEEKCFAGTEIFSNESPSGTSNLYANITAKDCVTNSVLHLPINGNATIIGSSSSVDGVLKRFSIISHSTNHIYISCLDPSNSENGVTPRDECKSLYINASDAQYLNVEISGEYELDEKSNNPAAIYCPQNSNYNSVSCYIDVSKSPIVDKVSIYALNVPQDLTFIGSNNVMNSTLLTCINDTVSVMNGSFENTGCFITEAPIANPSISPITSIPTLSPNINPTDVPSDLTEYILTIVETGDGLKTETEVYGTADVTTVWIGVIVIFIALCIGWCLHRRCVRKTDNSWL
eukprot:276478_1